MISADFPWPSGIRAEFAKDLKLELSPFIKELGFVVPGPEKKDRLPVKWYRDRGDTIDSICFQWDKYYRPSLVINFRSFNHPDDLSVCRDNPQSINAEDFGLRAHMKPGPFGWFQPSLLRCWINPKMAFEPVIQELKRSLADVSSVMKGGKASTPMQDSNEWLDPRLPDNPPPWNDGSGGVRSDYHLPPFRVGEGKKLGNWEV